MAERMGFSPAWSDEVAASVLAIRSLADGG
ncbi:hypothetical protein FHS08_000747 [Microbacterium ulmi]|nr:hypothetical protein [Microbacterium ulmi]